MIAAPPTAPPHCAAMNMTVLTGLILLVISMAAVKAGFTCAPESKNRFNQFKMSSNLHYSLFEKIKISKILHFRETSLKLVPHQLNNRYTSATQSVT